MALLWGCATPLSVPEFSNNSSFPMNSVPIFLTFRRDSVQSSSESFPSYPSPCSFQGRLSSNFSAQCEEFPSARIFIKGLAESTSEGTLIKTFSQFGKVSRVKILTDAKSRQSSGLAYVWFTTEGLAELAVKEMNGKFFDGKFISVMIARLGPSRRRGTATPYKF